MSSSSSRPPTRTLSGTSHRSSTQTRVGKDVRANLLLLEYNGCRTAIPRPQDYQALLESARRCIREIPKDYDVFVFETNELDISAGTSVIISEDAWEIVAPLIQTVKVIVSSVYPGLESEVQTKNEVAGSSKPSQSVVGVKRRREDSEPSYSVSVLSTTGQIYQVACSPFSTIAKVKSLIQNQSRISPDDQRISYEGDLLSDTMTLVDYGIRSGATLDLTIQQIAGKPVIYLYSPTPTRVSTKLSLVPEWEFSAVHPISAKMAMGESQEIEWVVDVLPNGTLREVSTGLEVAYLYWEARTNTHGLSPQPTSPFLQNFAAETIHEESFVPNRATLDPKNSVLLEVDKITPYLDSSLKYFGLHVEARTSFITYWLPSVLKHKNIALRFLPQSAYERAAPLRLDPVPDVVVRIFMLFKGIDAEQLDAWNEASDRKNDPVDFWTDVVAGTDADRLGDTSLFRVIEWGGMEIL